VTYGIDALSWGLLALMLVLAAKSMPALALAGLFDRVLRRAPARARHLLWVAALASLALLPLAAAGPRWEPQLLQSIQLPARGSSSIGQAPAASSRMPETASQRGEGVESSTAPAPSLDSLVRSIAAPGPRLRRLAAGLYLAGIAAGLAFLAAGTLRVARLCRRAEAVSLADLGESTDGARARIRLSSEVEAPFTWGLGRRPYVILPETALTWPRERLRNALVHELAHVARRDLWTQLLARLVCLLYWFLPLAWWAERKLRLEAERACDERVLASGSSAPEYAEQLVELARRVRSRPLRSLAPAVGPAVELARGAELSTRVESVLAPTSRRLRPLATALCALAVLALGGVAGMLHPAEAAAFGRRTAAPLRVDGSDLPPLFRAVDRGDVDEVRRLIAAGADVDRRVKSRGTALIRAASWGDEVIVAELLDAGADPNRVEAAGERPEGLQRTALTAAAASGSREIVERLLAAGVEVEAAPEGDASALMEAAYHRHREIVELLLAAGADPNRRLEGDGTPLIEAVRGGSEEIVRRLLAAGAEAAVGVEGDGNPLIAAVELGDRSLVELLLEAGADPYAYVPGDESAVTRAAENGRRDLLELMVGWGDRARQEE
jgi:beta-lactamase regulating signal transducer with metallopeptidase domain/ankyrin repeat protein